MASQRWLKIPELAPGSLLRDTEMGKALLFSAHLRASASLFHRVLHRPD